MRVVKKKREIVVGEISTPGMADIAFQLIIFFLLTTVFMHEHGLRLVLPEKGEEVRVKRENIAEVYVNARGQVKIKDIEVPVDRIREFAEQLLKENPKIIFSLYVDHRCPYEKVIKVFDELKLANAKRIAFAPPRRGG